MKPIFIYLIERNNIPIYIGASFNVKQRFSCHKSTTFKKNTNGLSYKILEECTKDNVSKQEIYWIDFYTKNGHTLLNKSMGGYSCLAPNPNEMIAIKIDAKLVEQVRQLKKITGIPIGKFIEDAALELLEEISKKRK